MCKVDNGKPCSTEALFPKTFAAWRRNEAALKQPIRKPPVEPPRFPPNLPHEYDYSRVCQRLGVTKIKLSDLQEQQFESALCSACECAFRGELSFKLETPLDPKVPRTKAWLALGLDYEPDTREIRIREDSEYFYTLSEQWRAYIPLLDEYTAAETDALAAAATFTRDREVPVLDERVYRGPPESLFKRRTNNTFAGCMPKRTKIEYGD
jgi:hypothetical protein